MCPASKTPVPEDCRFRRPPTPTLCTVQWLPPPAAALTCVPPLQVRVQLFQGSPTPVTLDGEDCVPFKTTYGGGGGGGGGEREVWESGCVQDPASPLYQRCAVEVDQRSRPERTEYCAKPKEHMKVRRQLRNLEAKFVSFLVQLRPMPPGGRRRDDQWLGLPCTWRSRTTQEFKRRDDRFGSSASSLWPVWASLTHPVPSRGHRDRLSLTLAGFDTDVLGPR